VPSSSSSSHAPHLPAPRYYFYGLTASDGALLLEFSVDAGTRATRTVVKAERGRGLVPQFAELWGNCLMGFCR